ncbi:VOC family protein [Frankia sp. CNm7]|uniref:VOC family protein n=1 Tax=Frankia nepalensis TaxID=1836974 RepID=A0A937UVJ5_9ACTN|nr:VOC family protein [Frankia nepalensis]MBL7500931.1 VOC family protein [Frankia nepalensis]MBL7510094.1 VOC family protein [Frankia nepalensis]MBL7518438.1 VOC family protein [Frankia nepalensis]MBL7633300.1 VOC family protein [Frankia nepalensis]
MTTLRPENQYHVGVVVDDFEGTLKRLTELFGYEWCDELVADTAVRIYTADGPVDTTITTRFTYSVNEPRLEIIRPIPDSVWTPADSGVHHLGYWSDDVPGDSAALIEQGLPIEVAGIGPDGVPYWVYHRGPDGPRVELVSSRIKPGLEQYWASGRNPR